MMIAGALGAQGTRWITLVRELVIVVVFFAAALGTAGLRPAGRTMQLLLLGVAFVMTVSSAASLLAFVTQSIYPFKTPIANMVPEVISSTRLGELTFTDRSLGTTSVFLGALFVRAQGLFLFSTSQAVAQAAAIPLFLAAAGWYRPARWWFFLAASLSAISLLATTTRVPIAALLVSMTIALVGFQLRRHGLALRRRFNRRLLSAAALLIVALFGVAFVTGVVESTAQVLTARSLGPRAELYAETIKRWTERPLLGWGTEIDWIRGPSGSGEDAAVTEESTQAAADSPPLGSHSHYLGVLFKQGAVGFVLFTAIVVMLLGVARRQLRSGQLETWLLVAAVATTFISALTESLWLDPAASVVVAITWGVLLALPRAASQETDS